MTHIIQTLNKNSQQSALQWIFQRKINIINIYEISRSPMLSSWNIVRYREKCNNMFSKLKQQSHPKHIDYTSPPTYYQYRKFSLWRKQNILFQIGVFFFNIVSLCYSAFKKIGEPKYHILNNETTGPPTNQLLSNQRRATFVFFRIRQPSQVITNTSHRTTIVEFSLWRKSFRNCQISGW